MSERGDSRRERAQGASGIAAGTGAGARGPGARAGTAEAGTASRPGPATGWDPVGSADGAAAAAPTPLAVRLVLGVLVALAAAALAMIECFLVPLRIGTVPLPLCVPLAVAGNVVLARLAGGLTGRPLAGVLPPALWLVVVLVLAAPRAEGDLIVPGTLTGLVFLFAGAVAGAYGAATTVTRRRNPTIAARG